MIISKYNFSWSHYAILAGLVWWVMNLGSVGYALTPYEKMQSPIYQNGKIYVYPQSRHPKSHVRDWCGSRKYPPAIAKLKVLYEFSHKEREVLLSPHFESFVDQEIRPVLSHYCNNNPMYVDLYFYQSGDMKHYDRIRFQLRSAEGNNIVKQIRTDLNEKHPRNKMVSASRDLGSCSSGPFCDLGGGNYLNAIYENDVARIQKLDAKIIGEFNNKPEMKDIKKMYSIFTEGLQRKQTKEKDVDPFQLKDFSMLNMLAIKYMALYGNAPRKTMSKPCLQPGAMKITKKDAMPVINFEDQYGISQGSVGGDVYGQVYIINKEFVPLCKRICNAGGKDGSNLFASLGGLYKAKLVLNGIDQIITQLDCNSAEVKQFERNLISLTKGDIRKHPKNNVQRSVSKSATPQTKRQLPIYIPKGREKQLVIPSVREPRGRDQVRRRTRRERTTAINPPKVPVTRNRAGSRSTPTVDQKTREQIAKENIERTQRLLEKQQNMLKESQAASQAIQEKYKDTLQALTDRLRKATTHEEQLAIQKEVMAIRQSSMQELQKAMKEIQNKYLQK